MGGGTSQPVLDRIKDLENKYESLAQALTGKLDASKVTGATTVTEIGYAADARQLNPAVAGSLSNELENVNRRFSWISLSFSERKNIKDGDLMRTVTYNADLSSANEICLNLSIKNSRPCGQFTFQLGLGTIDKFIYFVEHTEYYWRGYLSINKQENKITISTYKNNSDLEHYYLIMVSAWIR